MGRVRTSYTAKFKLEVVKYAEENGKREAGRKYDVDPKNVHRGVLCSEYKPHPSFCLDILALKVGPIHA